MAGGDTAVGATTYEEPRAYDRRDSYLRTLGADEFTRVAGYARCAELFAVSSVAVPWRLHSFEHASPSASA